MSWHFILNVNSTANTFRTFMFQKVKSCREPPFWQILENNCRQSKAPTGNRHRDDLLKCDGLLYAITYSFKKKKKTSTATNLSLTLSVPVWLNMCFKTVLGYFILLICPRYSIDINAFVSWYLFTWYYRGPMAQSLYCVHGSPSRRHDVFWVCQNSSWDALKTLSVTKWPHLVDTGVNFLNRQILELSLLLQKLM